MTDFVGSRTLDIPETLKLTESAPGTFDPIAFGHYLLTSLFQHDTLPALLHAEYLNSEKSVNWFLRLRGSDQPDEIIAVSRSHHFRSVLANYFCLHFSEEGVYGGFWYRFLRQNGEVHRCSIYMSNTSLSDYWIRVYASVLDPRELSGPIQA